MKSILVKLVERANRNMLLFGTGMCVLAVGFLWWYRHDFQVLGFGPEMMKEAELVYLADLHTLKTPYVGIKGTRVINTGYQHFDVSLLGRTRQAATYVALAVGDRLLMVKAAEVNSVPSYTGRLVKMPIELVEEVVTPLEKEYPAIAGTFMPFVLDSTGIPLFHVARFLMTLAVLVLGLFIIQRAARALEEPSAYPAIRRLAGWGAFSDLAHEVELEWNAQGKTEIGSITITPSWLVACPPFRVEVVSLRDLAWFYKGEGKSWDFSGKQELICHDSFGNRIVLAETESNIEKIFSTLLMQAPWAVSGYNRNLEILWNADRRAFLAEVDERRHQAA